jgi:hypothetical protein
MVKRSSRSDTTFLRDAKNQYKVWKTSYKEGNKKYSDKLSID